MHIHMCMYQPIFFTLNNERIRVNNDVILEVIVCYSAITLHYSWFHVNFHIKILLIYYYPCCRLGPDMSPTSVYWDSCWFVLQWKETKYLSYFYFILKLFPLFKPLNLKNKSIKLFLVQGLISQYVNLPLRKMLMFYFEKRVTRSCCFNSFQVRHIINENVY